VEETVDVAAIISISQDHLGIALWTVIAASKPAAFILMARIDGNFKHHSILDQMIQIVQVMYFESHKSPSWVF